MAYADVGGEQLTERDVQNTETTKTGFFVQEPMFNCLEVIYKRIYKGGRDML